MHSGTKFITSEANNYNICITIKSNSTLKLIIFLKKCYSCRKHAGNKYDNEYSEYNKMTFEQVFKLQPNIIYSSSVLLEAPQNPKHSPDYFHCFVVECLELLQFLFLFVLLFFFVFLKPL